MKVYAFLILFVVISTSIPIYVHFRVHNVISNIQISLSFFLSLNSLICLWEIALGRYISVIYEDYQKLKSKYGNRRLQAVLDFMNYSMSSSDYLSMRFWSRIWSTYSVYDPSYSNRESFGFFVDVGNGWTTLLPSLLFLCTMTFHGLFEARLIGLMGIIKFYQEFYGTCIYFLSFFFNKRHVDKSIFEVALFVGFTNGLWFVFPLLGMYGCSKMVYTNTYDFFL